MKSVLLAFAFALLVFQATSLRGFKNHELRAHSHFAQVANCAAYNGQGQCSQCFFRYVVINNTCVAVSDQCKSWDNSTAACTSCYDGWTLSNGQCTSGGSSGNTEPQTEPDSGSANNGNGNNGGSTTTCYYRQVFVGGKCINVSDQCKTWSNTTGDCQSCYPGWNLNAGKCTA